MLIFGNSFMNFHKMLAMTRNSLQMCIMFYDNIKFNKFFVFSFVIPFPLPQSETRSAVCFPDFCRPCGITAKFPLVTCKWQWGNSRETHGLSLSILSPSIPGYLLFLVLMIQKCLFMAVSHSYLFPIHNKLKYL